MLKNIIPIVIAIVTIPVTTITLTTVATLEAMDTDTPGTGHPVAGGIVTITDV